MTGPGLLFTRIASTKPPILAKVFDLNARGELLKASRASMVEGLATRACVADLVELSSLLDGLKSNEAVTWGIAERETARIVAQEALEAAGGGAIARDREHFTFVRGPGVMMIDHDGSRDAPLSLDELRQILISVCPALAAAPMLCRPSASAGIGTIDGRQLSGPWKHRIYLPVTDASAIPEAGRRLMALLWAGGHGWVQVGEAGQALLRTVVDGAVWQPERLDFAAPSVLLDGILVRDRIEPVFFGDPKALFDLSLIAADATVEKRARLAQQAARNEAKDACASARKRWAAARAPGLAKERGITEPKARALLLRASEREVLMGDFTLTAQGGERVSVSTILNAPDRWHGTRFADPLGGYPDDDRIAVAQLTGGGRPSIFSHGHGGICYELMRQADRVQVGRGLRVQATDAVLSVLRGRAELWEFGEGAVAYVAGGRARTASFDWLLDHTGRAIDFFSVRTTQDENGAETRREVAEDPPAAIARAVLAKHGERGFRPLLAVVSAPTLRLDGSVLDRPGYDEAARLVYVTDEVHPPRVPDRPTPSDALAALAKLWAPFADFPLVDAVSRGVVLQGLVTACLRATLPTAPGIALDAPAAGTGKTLLARCLGALAAGTDPAILPPADSDEETRKRLFSALREGARTVLLDNLREPLGCASLDAFLTAPLFSDRILGSSETASLPNRALFIATGNNVRLTGDTCRRVFVARLDARSERPYARDFAFDPLQRVTAKRLEFVVAALTIVRAYIAAGRPRVAAGRTASFEAWDDLVRQPVCWLAQVARDAGRVDLPTIDDPLKAAETAFEADPETAKLNALLASWRAAFGSKATSVAQAIKHADGWEGADENALRAVLDEIAGQNGRINSRVLGRWIERQAGRRLGGMWFVRVGLRAGVLHWAVHDPSALPVGNTPTTTTRATDLGGGLVGLVASGGFPAADRRASSADRPRRAVINSLSLDEEADAA